MKARKITLRNFEEFKIGDKVICKGNYDGEGVFFGSQAYEIKHINNMGRLMFSGCSESCHHPKSSFKKVIK